MHEIKIDSRSLNLISRFIRQQQLEAPELLAAIEKAQRQPRIAINLWWTLLESLAIIAPAKDLGLKVGQCVVPQDIGVLAYLVTSSRCLLEAVPAMQRYQPILHNLSDSSVIVEEDRVIATWDGHGNTSTTLSNDAFISAIMSLINQFLTPHEIKAISINFPGLTESDLAIYQNFFACEVTSRWDQFLTLVLPISVLKTPMSGSDPCLKGILEQQAEAALSRVQQPDQWVEKLRTDLTNGLKYGKTSAKCLAESAGISERTLHRQLKSRRLSFQLLLDSIRYDLAKHYLSTPELNLSEIALLLGFSEQSAFSRAFKRWSGMTPIIFRSMNL